MALRLLSNNEYHPGSRDCDNNPGTLSLDQVTAKYLKIGNPHVLTTVDEILGY